MDMTRVEEGLCPLASQLFSDDLVSCWSWTELEGTTGFSPTTVPCLFTMSNKMSLQPAPLTSTLAGPTVT